MQPVIGREELSKSSCWAAHGKAELAWGRWGCSSLPSQGLGDLCTKPPCSRGVTQLGLTAPPRCAPGLWQEQSKLQASHTGQGSARDPGGVPGQGAAWRWGAGSAPSTPAEVVAAGSEAHTCCPGRGGHPGSSAGAATTARDLFPEGYGIHCCHVRL